MNTQYWRLWINVDSKLDVFQLSTRWYAFESIDMMASLGKEHRGKNHRRHTVATSGNTIKFIETTQNEWDFGQFVSAIRRPIFVIFSQNCSPIIRTVRLCFSFCILARISQGNNVFWRYRTFFLHIYSRPATKGQHMEKMVESCSQAQDLLLLVSYIRIARIVREL